MPVKQNAKCKRAADLGQKVIDLHSEATGAVGNEYTDCATDIICDIRHWCDRVGIDFYDALANSYIHYRAERNGEP